jgi:hypothetical protein
MPMLLAFPKPRFSWDSMRVIPGKLVLMHSEDPSLEALSITIHCIGIVELCSEEKHC